MANPLKGEVGFTANGDDYILQFNTNALISLEERLGVPISRMGALLAEGVSVGAVRSMLWAGLLSRHNMSLEEAGTIMDAIGLERAAELAADALQKSMPKGDADGADRPRKAAAGTGNRS